MWDGDYLVLKSTNGASEPTLSATAQDRRRMNCGDPPQGTIPYHRITPQVFDIPEAAVQSSFPACNF